MTGPVESTTAAPCAALHFEGDLDVIYAPWAKAEVRRLLQTNASHLVLDFRNVAFIDSAGVSLLLFIYAACRARRGRAVLARVSTRVRKLLGIAGLLTKFDLFNSLEEATSALQHAPG